MTDLLPERDRPAVRDRIRAAWSLTDAELARQRLELLATELDRTWPDAAGSLREGMADTLTLMRLGIEGQRAWVWRRISIIDSHGFVEHSVLSAT